MNNNDIQTLFEKTRNKSIKIIENLSPEDMNIQSMEDSSPIKWHLAHTTWFFEKFVLSKINLIINILMRIIIIYLILIMSKQVQDTRDHFET